MLTPCNTCTTLYVLHRRRNSYDGENIMTRNGLLEALLVVINLVIATCVAWTLLVFLTYFSPPPPGPRGGADERAVTAISQAICFAVVFWLGALWLLYVSERLAYSMFRLRLLRLPHIIIALGPSIISSYLAWRWGVSHRLDTFNLTLVSTGTLTIAMMIALPTLIVGDWMYSLFRKN